MELPPPRSDLHPREGLLYPINQSTPQFFGGRSGITRPEGRLPSRVCLGDHRCARRPDMHNNIRLKRIGLPGIVRRHDAVHPTPDNSENTSKTHHRDPSILSCLFCLTLQCLEEAIPVCHSAEGRLFVYCHTGEGISNQADLSVLLSCPG